MRSGRAAAAVVGCLVVAACSGSAQSAPTRAASTGPVATRTVPSPTAVRTAAPVAQPTRCGAGAQALWLRGPHGMRLEANVVGAGHDGVVLLHEAGNAGMCGFWPFARWLAHTSDVRAVLVDRCGYGQSACPAQQPDDSALAAQTAPAVDWLRKHGAQRITLVGASSGGSDALGAAGSIDGLSAVVDLSGDGTDLGTHTDTYYARRVHVPTLIAVAAHDAYCPVSGARAVAAAVAGPRTRLIVVRSMPTAHGWTMLHTAASTSPTPLAQTVAAWIAGGYGPSPVTR